MIVHVQHGGKKGESFWKPRVTETGSKDGQMNISQLPLELIDEILKHLDSISLVKSREVCRSWRALHFQRKYNLVWRCFCLRDIDRDILIEITGKRAIFGCEDPDSSNKSKKHASLIDGVDWTAVYREWFRSRHIGKWPSMSCEFNCHRGE